MNTTVRYFPRAGVAMIRSRSVTTTFRAHERSHVNRMLEWLGYRRVSQWEPDGATFVGNTERLRAQAAA